MDCGSERNVTSVIPRLEYQTESRLVTHYHTIPITSSQLILVMIVNFVSVRDVWASEEVKMRKRSALQEMILLQINSHDSQYSTLLAVTPCCDSIHKLALSLLLNTSKEVK